MESRHPAEVRALLAWLGGHTGIGTTTHARLAQCFFGDFSAGSALANFGGTALSLEDAGHAYRGALMVIDDAKRVVLGPDALRAFEGFVQRASDRSARTRLRQDGSPVPARPFRATALFTGEDLVLTSAAGAARLLILQVPAPTGSDADLAAIGELLPGLSGATRGFVEWLVQDDGRLLDGWAAWRAARGRALEVLASDPNRSRIAGSVASVVAGFHLWSAWLDSLGVGVPCSVDALHAWLEGSTSRQVQAMEDLSPGTWFLEHLRAALATGRATLHGEAGGDRCVGLVDPERRVAYVQPEAALSVIRQHLVARDAPTHPATAIVEDLDQLGALVERDKGGRRTKRKRIRPGEPPATTWAISAALLMLGDDAED